jgi:acetolactate synthase-1/2/3 large subunit
MVLESDGSGLYMPQSLWTMAHENLDVTVLIFANNRYRILQHEMVNVGGNGGPKASALFDLGDPDVDWVRLATGFGVEAFRVNDLGELAKTIRVANASSGPKLIEIPL